MKVDVFDRNQSFLKTIDNVVVVKSCIDGRTLVTHTKKCNCCSIVSRFVNQIPSDYSFQILLEESDEINLMDKNV